MYLNAQQLSPDVINGRKPGYPIDITSLSKMSSDETNQLAINYRNNGMHVGMVMLAKVHTPASIIKEIRKKNLVSAEEVRRRFFKGPEPGNEDDDDDLVSTGSLVSLKCPLGLMRIATPTRSKYCQHPQCFDCETFLQMKNQVPSTKCPVCSQDIKSWEELVIDLYFEDILQKTSSNEDQVYIEADGSWKPKKPMEAEDVDSIVANKRLRINGNSDAIDLSDYSSSEDPRPNRNKRQRTEVIDLTIDSDDGEDEYEYEYYDSESSRMDDMYFDMSFPSMTQEDIALIDAVEASTQGQNDRNLSVAERAGVRGQAVMTTRSSQQAVPTTSDSGSSHVN
ncbi:E3 SUMO-protein ligase pli1, partial [Coemansia sp. RSA 2603]